MTLIEPDVELAEIGTPTPPRPLRALLDEWLTAQAETGESVVTADLVRKAQQELWTSDEFVEAVFRDGVPMLITDYARDFFHKRRVEARDPRQPRATGWATRVFEATNGDNGRAYTPLLKLTRPDVVFACGERRKQIAGHERFLDLYDAVLALFTDDTTPLGEIITEPEFQTLWDEHMT